MIQRTPSTPASDCHVRDTLVVLVHGLGGSPLWLSRIEQRLRAVGFPTLNWGYRSYVAGVERHGADLRRLLDKFDRDADVRRLHLVTHSMGGILARYALADRHYDKLHRAVMLGPPHAGSRVATNLSLVFGRVLKPLTELADAKHSLVNRLPEPDIPEIGIIAARRDRVVHIDSTRLARLTDHLTIDSGHNSMLFRRDVANYVANFLRSGRFQANYEEKRP